MIADFHTHILPGVDDGSADLDQSLQMLWRMGQQQITRVVATPHFYASSDHPQRFLQRRDDAFASLQEAAPKGSSKVYLGAEVYYFEGISDCEALKDLTVAGSPYILIEMPYPPWTDRMYRELANIRQKQGLIPVIAHVDRYISPFHTHGIPENLAQLPVLVQANSSFFLRGFTRKMALRMLRQGQIHLLGSDCHNTTLRPPNLGQVVELIQKHAGQEALDTLLQNEAKILPRET